MQKGCYERYEAARHICEALKEIEKIGERGDLKTKGKLNVYNVIIVLRGKASIVDKSVFAAKF